MNDDVVYKLFPEPIFKYKLDNYEILIKNYQNIFINLEMKIMKDYKNLIKVDGIQNLLD